jgi:restriction endonuclease S subunit
MSKWEKRPLSELLRSVKRPVAVADLDEVPWAGVRWYAGGVYRRPTETASAVKTKTLNRLELNDIVYNRMWATKAAFGVVAGDSAGCLVTGDFPIFVADTRTLDPAFMRAVFQTSAFQTDASARAVGTTERRRLKEPDFLAMRVAMPSPPEQRRIVDVLSALDAQIAARAGEIERARATLSRLNSDLIEALPSSRTLGDFTAIRSGPSYAASDVFPGPRSGSVPVIGIPNTKPDGSLDLSQIGHVVGLSDSVGKVNESSLVLIRTNGNRQRIGNVYLPPPAARGHAVSAFQFLMKVDDPSDREFVYWALRESFRQAEMSEAASGTTGLGNLAVRWLNALEIPWSDEPDDRASVIRPLRSFQDAIDASSEELSHLKTFRSTLLTSLLNQEIEIPETYDALLEVT